MIHRASLWSIGIVLLVLSAPGVQGLPADAQKVGQPCSYCHLGISGSGRLNERGQYYAAHNRSLDGYVAPATDTDSGSNKGGPPLYAPVWRLNLAANVTRVASADLVKGQKPRLLVLSPDNKLTIADVTAEQPVVDQILDLGESGSRFVVGQFAHGKPAVIAAPGVIWYRDADRYLSKTVSKLTDVTGMIRFFDKQEAILEVDGAGEHLLTVDLASAGEAVLQEDKHKLVSPDQAAGVYLEAMLRPGEDALKAVGAPDAVRKLGILGLVDPREAKRSYLWLPVPFQDDREFIALAEVSAGLGAASGKVVWQSRRHPGTVIDIFYGPDPKGGKAPGVLVLWGTGTGNKERLVEFFALE